MQPLLTQRQPWKPANSGRMAHLPVRVTTESWKKIHRLSVGRIQQQNFTSRRKVPQQQKRQHRSLPDRENTFRGGRQTVPSTRSTQLAHWQDNAFTKFSNNIRHDTVKEAPRPSVAKASWEDYLPHFELMAEINGWNNTKKAINLSTVSLGDLNTTGRKDYMTLTLALSSKFGTENRSCSATIWKQETEKKDPSRSWRKSLSDSLDWQSQYPADFSMNVLTGNTARVNGRSSQRNASHRGLTNTASHPQAWAQQTL